MRRARDHDTKASPRRRAAWFVLAVTAVALPVVWLLLPPGGPGLAGLSSYVRSGTCGECHAVNHPRWKESLHAKMVQVATTATVIGDFEQDNEYWLHDGVYGDAAPAGDRPLVRMVRRDREFSAEIYDPTTGRMNPYRITHVVGTAYRQVYLVESDGVFFRVPIQWSVQQRRWVNLWNRQARQDESPERPMEHFLNVNGHWDEFCARCHTTGYRTRDGGQWAELGVACEACHGAGAGHVAYFRDSTRLRLRSELLGLFGVEPGSFIVRPSSLSPERSVAVCGQCHQGDIWLDTVEAFVDYRPGEDLSGHFYEIPLEPGIQEPPSNKTWPDGSPKGAGLLFRSFVESRCFTEGGVTCVDCHDPHRSGEHAPLLQPGVASDRLCIRCHEAIGAGIEQHTRHRGNGEGSRCYGCHMPRTLEGLVMVGDFDYAGVRTHELDHIPYPESSVRFGGAAAMPNACNDCHADRSAEWAVEWSRKWWGPREEVGDEIEARFAPRRGVAPDRAAGI